MDGGASQFTGGGFLATQGDGGGSAQKSRVGSTQTLRAITVKQLAEATQNQDDDQFYIDGQELSNITVLGRIVSTEEQATCISFTVDDGTGTTDVRYWIDREDSDMLRESKLQWHVGAYIRIYGNVRTFNESRHVVAFNIRTITDYNEVTYHFLQTIFQHEHLKQGASGAGPAGQSPMPVKTEPAFGGFNTPAPTGGISMAIGDDGMNDAQRMCRQLFDSPDCNNLEAGFSMQDVINRLQGKLTPAQVKDAVEFLVQECHVYTTTDDEHFKSTNCN